MKNLNVEKKILKQTIWRKAFLQYTMSLGEKNYIVYMKNLNIEKKKKIVKQTIWQKAFLQYTMSLDEKYYIVYFMTSKN